MVRKIVGTIMTDTVVIIMALDHKKNTIQVCDHDAKHHNLSIIIVPTTKYTN